MISPIQVTRLCALLLVLALTGAAYSADGARLQLNFSTTVTVPLKSPDYASLFAKYDAGLNDGEGMSYSDNAQGQLAWLQSYQMLAYARIYQATQNTHWLDQLATQFARVLDNRDDRLGRADIYTSTPLKGWGTSSYDKKGWHVFVVHTGMICQGAAEFVRIVRDDSTLTKDYGTTATYFLTELEAMAADADRYFRTNAKGEGWYSDPAMPVVPLNMSNAMGSVLVELYSITGKEEYRTSATALAKRFKNCLHEGKVKDTWNWAYWPKTSADRVITGEDISHASINVEFAAKCHQAGIVFTQVDMEQFASTWLNVVMKLDGSGYTKFVDGTGISETTFYQQSAGRWLGITRSLTPHLRTLFARAIGDAMINAEIVMPSRALGVANLALYMGSH